MIEPEDDLLEKEAQVKPKMPKFWQYIKIDTERIPLTKLNYKSFQKLLAQIDCKPKKEQFPRVLAKDIPTPSYGVITVYDDGENFHYFSTQRRVTIEFGEVLRCGPRKEHLFEYLSVMTMKERALLQMIAENPDSFHQLWQDFMLTESTLFTKTERKTRKIFDAYAPYLSKLLEYTTSYVLDAPWGFPKGREKVGDKTGLQSALRELKEEGKLVFNKVDLMWSEPVQDIERGTDGCLYHTTYYVVKAEHLIYPKITHNEQNLINDKYVSLEMQDFQWIKCSKNEHIKHGSTPLPQRLELILTRLHDNLRKMV
jgi:hypothetical protein